MPNRIAEILKQSYVTRTSGYLDITAKTDLFKEISSLTGGVFSISHTQGNVLSTLRIAIPYRNCEIMLTESDTQPLKFQIGFVSLHNYELIIGVEDAIDKIMKILGRAEIMVGDADFDNQYFIHGNDPALTVKLLSENVRNLIRKHSVYNISYLTDHKKKKAELITVVSRTVEDKEVYLDLITLHQMLIDNLLELGII